MEYGSGSKWIGRAKVTPNLRDSVLEATLHALGHGGTDSIDDDDVLGGLDTDLCGDGGVDLGSCGLDGQVGRDLSKTGGHDVRNVFVNEEGGVFG